MTLNYVYEFIIMNVNTVLSLLSLLCRLRILWNQEWIHKWNHNWIYQSKIIQDSVSNLFQWWKTFYSSKIIINPASSAAATGLLRGCCCCDKAELGERGGPFKHMMDVTGVEICRACLAGVKETFKLRDYQRGQPQGHSTDWAIRSSEGFRAGNSLGKNWLASHPSVACSIRPTQTQARLRCKSLVRE